MSTGAVLHVAHRSLPRAYGFDFQINAGFDICQPISFTSKRPLYKIGTVM
jgi:hypothetical protein